MHGHDLDDDRTIVTDVEFALADAEWRHEVGQALGRVVEDDELVSSEFRGRAGSPLRRAFEQRRRAFSEWRTVRGVP